MKSDMQDHSRYDDDLPHSRRSEDVADAISFVKGIMYILLFIASGFTVYYNIILEMQEMKNNHKTDQIKITNKLDIIDTSNKAIVTRHDKMENEIEDLSDIIDDAISDIKEHNYILNNMREL